MGEILCLSQIPDGLAHCRRARDLLIQMQEVDRLQELDKATIQAALDFFSIEGRFQRLVHTDDSTVAAR